MEEKEKKYKIDELTYCNDIDHTTGLIAVKFTEVGECKCCKQEIRSVRYNDLGLERKELALLFKMLSDGILRGG